MEDPRSSFKAFPTPCGELNDDNSTENATIGNLLEYKMGRQELIIFGHVSCRISQLLAPIDSTISGTYRCWVGNPMWQISSFLDMYGCSNLNSKLIMKVLFVWDGRISGCTSSVQKFALGGRVLLLGRFLTASNELYVAWTWIHSLSAIPVASDGWLWLYVRVHSSSLFTVYMLYRGQTLIFGYSCS